MASRNARLTAAITGKGREVGPEEAHARAVLAITRRIHTREARRRRLQAELKKLGQDLRADRLELRAVLQRDASISIDSPVLELAGQADAIDAVHARLERPTAAPAVCEARTEVVRDQDPFGGAGKDGGQ
jgi:hypothetical protein